MDSFAALRISYAGPGVPATPPEGECEGEMRRVMLVGDTLVLCSMGKSIGPHLIRASSWGIRDINDYIYN